jgi:murein DD-endopeptidase MepM/ murein hydrolase activator NlpD
MKGLTLALARMRSIGRHAALICVLAWTGSSAAAQAQELCLPSAPCEPLPGAAAFATAAVQIAIPGLSGGGRATLRSSSELDRQDFVIGSVNADHDDAYQYRMPYGDAVSYVVLQGYGSKFSHRGVEYFTVDFRMDVGTPVHAARDGVVVLIQNSMDGACWNEGCGHLANFVVLLHSDGTTGEYFHLERGSVCVSLGEHVRRGQPIARSGNTGYSTVPHLHFGVYRADSRGQTRSVAVRFVTREGPIAEPRIGMRYLNAD